MINRPLMWEPSWSCTRIWFMLKFYICWRLSMCLVERIVSIKQEQNNKILLRRTWSIVIIKWPYLKDFTLVYSLCCWSPRIYFMYPISLFSVSCLAVASLTLSNLPLNGNTPWQSWPTAASPANCNRIIKSKIIQLETQ